MAGATLLLPRRAEAKEQLGPLLARSGATHVCSTPALWATVELSAAELPALRCVCLGGEAMAPALIRRWAAALPLHNIYGVTECTVYQASRRVRAVAEPEPPPTAAEEAAAERAAAREAGLLGAPLPGCTLTLLDDSLRPVAADGSGEGQLAIGGPQLAIGYLGQPELTAERFVDVDGERLYLTGDLAKWDGGELRLVGRADRQVQLRGLRLELGEVEGVLCGCALVRRAAATVDGHALLAAIEPADADLAAAAASGDDGGDDAAAERRDELAAAAVALVAAHVRRWLPAAACPRRIALVAALPLTPTGKLDRATLLETLRRGEASGDDGAAARPTRRRTRWSGRWRRRGRRCSACLCAR